MWVRKQEWKDVRERLASLEKSRSENYYRQVFRVRGIHKDKDLDMKNAIEIILNHLKLKLFYQEDVLGGIRLIKEERRNVAQHSK